MAAKAEKSELDMIREELERERAEKRAMAGELNEARTAKQQAELAGMTETERRLHAEELAADNAIASAENEATALEGQIAALNAEGNFTGAASLYRKLAGAENRIQNEQMRKDYLAGQRELAKNQRTQHAETPVQQTQTSSALPPRIQSWIDQHPKFKTWANPDGTTGYADKAYYHRAMSGHNEAIANGAEPGSAAYFEIVETHTGDREPEESPYSGSQSFGGQSFGGNQQDDMYSVERPQRPAAGQGSMAAAPSRGAPGGVRPGRAPDLTADQKEMADSFLSHLPPAERYTRWARNMEKKGVGRGSTH